MHLKCDTPTTSDYSTAMDFITRHREHYDSPNKIAQYLLRSFKKSVLSLVHKTKARTLFDVGCGDGHLSLFLADNGYQITGGDINPILVEQANKVVAERNLTNATSFEVLDIYSYDFSKIHVDMALCCEVLEHLPDPLLALDRIAKIKTDTFLFSVPAEPIWRIMNICRLKYLSEFGNTPGHINHWGYLSFRSFLERRFAVSYILKPLPWIIALCKR